MGVGLLKIYRLSFFLSLVFIFFTLFQSQSAFANTEQYSLTTEMLDAKPQVNTKTSLKPLETLPITTVVTTKPLFMTHGLPSEKNQFSLKTQIDINYLFSNLKQNITEINKPATDAKFIIKNDRVSEFNPGELGFLLNIPETIIATVNNSNKANEEVKLIGISAKPYSSLEETNNLGIKQLIGRGRSTFKGSSKNRRINIKVALEKNRGILVPPDSTYSFNENVGGVVAEDGFVPEIVIKSTGLTPELGGGVCQVSSTIFRGAVASGLEIEQRKNHSFAVSHYNPQGTDATTYSGVIDLKFRNNTPGYILIWPYYENEDTIIFDYYGTRDGRLVTLKDPKIYDKKPDGSMKTIWERTVTKEGDSIEDSFYSNYLPPAIFKKVEIFVPVEENMGTTKPDTNTANPEQTNT